MSSFFVNNLLFFSLSSVFVRYINKDLVHLGCRDVYESKYL